MRFVGFTLLALAASALALPAQEPTHKELLLAVERQLQSLNETAGPGVACVVVSRSEQYPKAASAEDVPGKLGAFDSAAFLKANNTPANQRLAKSLDLSDPRSIPDHGFACGVVIDDKGLLLTPYHVIDGATKIFVHLPGRVGSYADIHAADARADLAVLKLITPPAGLKAVPFADVRLPGRGTLKPTVTVGKLVVLMANVYTPSAPRLGGPTAALGSIAAVQPPLEPPKQDITRRAVFDNYYYQGPLLAHDAKLNAGVSGAALLNLDGELVGLTTTAPILATSDKTADFAFPMDAGIRRVIEVLRRGEEVEYGFLGVRPDDSRGVVYVGSVIPLGPAARADVQSNDVITHVNGAAVRNNADLLVHVGSALAGTKVTLTIRRPNVTGDVTFTLGKLQHDRPLIASARPDAVFGLRVDHDSVLAQRVGDNIQAIIQKGIPEGVSVREVAADSPAATAFKKLGDDPRRWLVTHVNGTAVSTPAEFYAAAKGQKAVKLTVIDPTEAKRPPREVSFP